MQPLPPASTWNPCKKAGVGWGAHSQGLFCPLPIGCHFMERLCGFSSSQIGPSGGGSGSQGAREISASQQLERQSKISLQHLYGGEGGQQAGVPLTMACRKKASASIEEKHNRLEPTRAMSKVSKLRLRAVTWTGLRWEALASPCD